MHGAGADIFTANMYLAEDRVRFCVVLLLIQLTSRLAAARSYAGNLYQREDVRGCCIMSRVRMRLRMFLIRFVSFYLCFLLKTYLSPMC